MRFISAPWVGMLKDGSWLRYATNANAMAQLMLDKVAAIPGVKIMFPRQANSVFVELPEKAIEAMYKKGWIFYSFIGKGGCRLMCSWDTTTSVIENFASDLRAVLTKV